MREGGKKTPCGGQSRRNAFQLLHPRQSGVNKQPDIRVPTDMKTPLFRLAAGLVTAASSLSLVSCFYDPYGPGPGYSSGYYGGGSTSVFVSTGDPFWGYDPYRYCYYDYRRRCYYDPYLHGYYPVGYRPPICHGVPHPYGWRPGSGVCPPPRDIHYGQIPNYQNRFEQLRERNYAWVRDFRENRDANAAQFRNNLAANQQAYRDRLQQNQLNLRNQQEINRQNFQNRFQDNRQNYQQRLQYNQEQYRERLQNNQQQRQQNLDNWRSAASGRHQMVPESRIQSLPAPQTSTTDTSTFAEKVEKNREAAAERQAAFRERLDNARGR